MFVKNSERKDTAYFEFSYYKKASKLGVCRGYEHWLPDSLCVSIDDEKVFFENYGKYLENPHKPRKFAYFGWNYYTKKQTQTIIEQITRDKPQEYDVLLSWLELATDEYNGFYFLGI